MSEACGTESHTTGNYPERVAVARILIENGLNIKDRQIRCNGIRMFITSVAADMNSRTVKRTIDLIPQFLKIKGREQSFALLNVCKTSFTNIFIVSD